MTWIDEYLKYNADIRRQNTIHRLARFIYPSSAWTGGGPYKEGPDFWDDAKPRTARGFATHIIDRVLIEQ